MFSHRADQKLCSGQPRSSILGDSTVKFCGRELPEHIKMCRYCSFAQQGSLTSITDWREAMNSKQISVDYVSNLLILCCYLLKINVVKISPVFIINLGTVPWRASIWNITSGLLFHFNFMNIISFFAWKTGLVYTLITSAYDYQSWI